jgi:hypothetical protein
MVDFYGGVDLRYYKGVHTNVITDLYGGQFFIDATSTRSALAHPDQAWKTQKLGVGDVVYRDYDGYVMSQGLFGQAEYNQIKNLSTFISASVSRTSYWRYDRFYYEPSQAKSKTTSFWGYCLKGGANYNLTDQHNVFANVGIISRAPFFSGGAFLQSTISNVLNPHAINEKAFSAEVGYGFKSKYLSANVNIYRTKWMNKTIVRSSFVAQADPLLPAKIVSVNMEGVDALHQGVEIDFFSKPIKNLELSGMISIGDWNWLNNVTGYLYSDNGQPSNSSGNPVPFGDPSQQMTVGLKGIHVGNSAQTTAALGAKYELVKGFNLGIDANYYGRNYSSYSISPASSGFSSLSFQQPWQIPDAMIFDLNSSYRFKIGTFDATFIGNINNILNAEYIADATDDGTYHDWKHARVFYGFGRTFSATLKVKF